MKISIDDLLSHKGEDGYIPPKLYLREGDKITLFQNHQTVELCVIGMYLFNEECYKQHEKTLIRENPEYVCMSFKNGERMYLNLRPKKGIGQSIQYWTENAEEGEYIDLERDFYNVDLSIKVK